MFKNIQYLDVDKTLEEENKRTLEKIYQLVNAWLNVTL
jgi:hypothetical protein